MDTSPNAGDPSVDRAGAPPAPPEPSLAGFFDDVRLAFSARAHLLELEARQAAWAAAYMIGFAVAAALLGVTAWLILIGALMTLAVELGVPWWLVVVLSIAAHAGAAWLLLGRIRGLVNKLTFAATRRTLSPRTEGADHGRVV